MIAAEEYREQLPPEVVASGWLGYPPAAPDEIAVTEARLDMSLPPSYRAFLQVTNGWRMTTSFIERVRPAGEIGWYRDEAAETVAIWQGAGQPSDERNGANKAETPYMADLDATLAISDEGDGIYLLNPRKIGPDGEWEAWFFASWVPGEWAYPSFWEMMQSEHEGFLASLQE